MWEANESLFGDLDSPFGDANKVERKFNLKVRASDIVLLDELASYYEMPRSTLLNYILYKALLRSLGKTEEDAQFLIAIRADEKLREMKFFPVTYWTDDLMREKITEISYERLDPHPDLENEFTFEERHSEKFNILNGLFGEIDKK